MRPLCFIVGSAGLNAYICLNYVADIAKMMWTEYSFCVIPKDVLDAAAVFDVLIPHLAEFSK